MLRDYQQNAHDAAIDWIKRSIDPCVIEAATGSGKSHIIAALADTFYDISGKHVLCTAPSAELVSQNHAKFLATGNPASIFSASLGKRSLRHPVVFGTPGTIKNSIKKFGSQFGLVVIDEAHGITPTIKSIISSIAEENQRLRVVGLSATPYRLGTGLIYAMDEKGKPSRHDECKDPYFTARIYHIGARELIEQGYLTAPIIGSIHGEHYDTINMQVNSRGQFDKADIDKAYTGQGRKTSRIIEDIVEQARYRHGVMIFAATVEHAKECMLSLPREISALVTGETPKKERDSILNRFKSGALKYLVNVSVLTTGFDAPHVDLIAILRATESIGLLQQIIGRGLRVFQGKTDALILDYAENLERHCPDGDIFSPNMKVFADKKSSGIIKAHCPDCGTENEFSARQNDDGFAIDANGYFVDLTGNRIMTEHGPIPGHYGRRCMGLELVQGKYIQCEYRYTSKECPHCHEPNDISARYCHVCRGEIINPNDKLVIDFKARKKDPTQLQCDKVINWHVSNTLSSKGNECTKITYTTEYRTFTIWLQKRGQNAKAIYDYEKFLKITQGGEVMPSSVTYRKNPKTGFYEVKAYCEKPDVLELKSA